MGVQATVFSRFVTEENASGTAANSDVEGPENQGLSCPAFPAYLSDSKVPGFHLDGGLKTVHWREWIQKTVACPLSAA
jgi:hypothetical protein